jgi:hypothetical protein
MKRLLLLLILTPLITFSQVSSWRNNPPTRVEVGSSIQGQRSDISMWRNNPPREENRPRPTKPGSNVIITQPYTGWGWNRWDLWGAPMFGWNYYQPMWYFNDWGYRQPARVYVYENGKRDTIRGKKPIINFTLNKTTNKQIGVSFTVGNKNYFIMDFVSTYEPDKSTFFPNGRITQVDFPLINDLVKEKTIYFGFGKRHKKIGFHTMIGFGNERVLWRGKDAIGEITFPKYNTNFTTMKIGVMKDFNNITIKFDHDPIRKYSQFGLGLNL